MWWSTELLTNRDLAHLLWRKRKGVVEERHVREMVGVEVADPDRVQILEADVALERPKHAAADVHKNVGPAGL
jgi:hypothetical protein